MDTARFFPLSAATSFVLRGICWSLGIFGALRLNWIAVHAILPLANIQGGIAEQFFGTPPLPIEITLACSGADALALCTGATLAYPTTWPKRFVGAAGGIVLILVLNTLRIGTLSRAVASPFWFDTLHVLVWPAVLVLAISGYVFAWMRIADHRREIAAARGSRHTRFVWTVAAVMVMFVAAAPLYLDSAVVLALASLIARAAAIGLRVLGMDAIATGNVLATDRGAFLVTQECISTPLIPLYVAAVLTYASAWRERALAIAAFVPIFTLLGIARLLVVALPTALVGAPEFLIHAFYQFLLGAVIVCLAAVWRHGASAAAWQRALLGVVLGSVVIYLLDPAAAALIQPALAGARLEDPQGAIVLLPSYQFGLYAALGVAAFVGFTWWQPLAGLAVLGLSQVMVFAALLAAAAIGVAPHVREVRGWALAGPLLVVAALVMYVRPSR